MLICLDAGHGGYDPGAIGNYSQEKNINLAIVKKLQARLEELNIKTVLTRSDDSFVRLDDRAKISNKVLADLFISIHCNSVADKKAHGVETLFYKSGQDIAEIVQRNLVKNTGLTNRKAKYMNLSVTRETNAKAILIECAFISNPTEEQLLNDYIFQGKIIKSIVDAIKEYYKIGEKMEHWAKNDYNELVASGMELDKFDESNATLYAMMNKFRKTYIK